MRRGAATSAISHRAGEHSAAFHYLALSSTVRATRTETRFDEDDMGQLTEVKVPDIGDFDNVPVIEVLVKAGDTVSKDQGLITLESDKATMEVPSSTAGVVKEVKVKVGDEVSEGTVVVTLEASEGGGEKPAPKADAPKQ